jgi:dihydrofolate reductase
VSKVYAEISTSLDGYVAGPSPTREEPLGRGGERLHDWVIATRAWREAHGLEGGEENQDSELTRESQSAYGAVVMGRLMFSGGEGPWEQDTNSTGWWGDEPPFHVPVFVLTHHAREPLTLSDTTFTFVTDGIESAIAQAREAAGGRDVQISGGASAIGQALGAGLLDELNIHVAPLLLGDGTPLFGDYPGPQVDLEVTRVIESPAVTHLRYRVKR